MMDEKNIVEVEIVDSTLDDPSPRATTVKPSSDRRDQILFWGRFARFCFRFGFPALLLGSLSCLPFGILYSETAAVFYLVTLIIAASLAGLGLIGLGLGFIGTAMMKKYMKIDPNYEDQV